MRKIWQSRYEVCLFEGIEDALSVLSHKRLANIRTIRKGREYEQNYD